MSPLNSLLLILLLACSSGAYPTNSKPSSINQDDNFRHKSSTGRDSPTDSGKPIELSNRFLLMTNGRQLKLYLIEAKNSSIAMSDNYYLLKPRPFVDSEEMFAILGRNSLSKWLNRANKTKSTANAAGNKRKSILPTRDELEDQDEHYGNQDNDWLQPWITDVDYKVHCCNPTRKCFDKSLSGAKCLTIFWLDRRNQFIRWGSINLNEIPIEDRANLSRSKTIFFEEHRPLDFRNIDDQPSDYRIESISSISYNSVEVIGYSSALGKFSILRISLDGKMLTYKRDYVFDCPTEVASSTDVKKAKNLQFYGLRSFYLTICRGIGRINTSGKIDGRQDLFGFFEFSQSQNTITFTFDNKHDQIYLLDHEGEILSWSFSDPNSKVIGRLPNKFTSGEAFSMELYEKYLLISDPIKKSLLSIKLPEVGSSAIPAPKILSVEMNSFYGFKIITFDKVEESVVPSSIASNEEIVERKDFFQQFAISYEWFYFGFIAICIIGRIYYTIKDTEKNKEKLIEDA